MRLGTAILFTTLASLGASLWRTHTRTRALAVKATPRASALDGVAFPLLFSNHVQVAFC